MINYEDGRARLKLKFPLDWHIQTAELDPPLTTALTPSSEDDETRQARAVAEERRLWEEATKPDGTWEDDGDRLVDDEELTTVVIGRWQFDEEDLPLDDDLVESADLLANSYGEQFAVFPFAPVESLDHSRRRTTIGGLPAATATYRIVAEPHGGYLRAVVIELAPGSISFVIGLGRSDADRLVIDAMLDTIEPLSL